MLYATSVSASRILAGVLIAHFTLSIFPTGAWHLKANRWISGFLQWDGGWFLGIANSGYTHPRATAFFPGFPLLVDGVRLITFHQLSLYISAVITAWLSFTAAVIITNLTLGQLLGSEGRRVGTVLFAWSPASIFFLSAYPEGMLLALSAAALFFIRKRWYWSAALMSAFATTTTPLAIGVPCALGLALILAFRAREVGLGTVLAAALTSISGLLIWMIYLAIRFGNAFLFMTEQKTFNRSTAFPFSALGAITHLGSGAKIVGFPQGNWFDTRLFNICFIFLSLLLFLYFTASLFLPKIRRFPVSFCAYVAVTAFVPALSVQRFAGIPNPEAGLRLTSDNLGFYTMVAWLVNKRTSWILPVVCVWVALAVFVQAVFTNGYYFT